MENELFIEYLSNLGYSIKENKKLLVESMPFLGLRARDKLIKFFQDQIGLTYEQARLITHTLLNLGLGQKFQEAFDFRNLNNALSAYLTPRKARALSTIIVETVISHLLGEAEVTQAAPADATAQTDTNTKPWGDQADKVKKGMAVNLDSTEKVAVYDDSGQEIANDTVANLIAKGTLPNAVDPKTKKLAFLVDAPKDPDKGLAAVSSVDGKTKLNLAFSLNKSTTTAGAQKNTQAAKPNSPEANAQKNTQAAKPNASTTTATNTGGATAPAIPGTTKESAYRLTDSTEDEFDIIKEYLEREDEDVFADDDEQTPSDEAEQEEREAQELLRVLDLFKKMNAKAEEATETPEPEIAEFDSEGDFRSASDFDTDADTVVSDAEGGSDAILMPPKTGGLGDGIDENSVDEEQLSLGIEIEYEEHIANNFDLSEKAKREMAKSIALDHLREDPEYYSKLLAMEDGACDDVASEYGKKDLEDVVEVNESNDIPLNGKTVLKGVTTAEDDLEEPKDKKSPLPQVGVNVGDKYQIEEGELEDAETGAPLLPGEYTVSEIVSDIATLQDSDGEKHKVAASELIQNAEEIESPADELSKGDGLSVEDGAFPVPVDIETGEELPPGEYRIEETTDTILVLRSDSGEYTVSKSDLGGFTKLQRPPAKNNAPKPQEDYSEEIDEKAFSRNFEKELMDALGEAKDMIEEAAPKLPAPPLPDTTQELGGFPLDTEDLIAADSIMEEVPTSTGSEVPEPPANLAEQPTKTKNAPVAEAPAPPTANEPDFKNLDVPDYVTEPTEKEGEPPQPPTTPTTPTGDAPTLPDAAPAAKVPARKGSTTPGGAALDEFGDLEVPEGVSEPTEGVMVPEPPRPESEPLTEPAISPEETLKEPGDEAIPPPDFNSDSQSNVREPKVETGNEGAGNLDTPSSGEEKGTNGEVSLAPESSESKPIEPNDEVSSTPESSESKPIEPNDEEENVEEAPANETDEMKKIDKQPLGYVANPLDPSADIVDPTGKFGADKDAQELYTKLDALKTHLTNTSQNANNDGPTPAEGQADYQVDVEVREYADTVANLMTKLKESPDAYTKDQARQLVSFFSEEPIVAPEKEEKESKENDNSTHEYNKEDEGIKASSEIASPPKTADRDPIPKSLASAPKGGL
jgi:hypothetical protein